MDSASRSSDFNFWSWKKLPGFEKIAPKKVQNSSKSRFLSSPGTLECSDHPHTVSTCATHEYYRLREFQKLSTTFHAKNHDFGAGGGTKLKMTYIHPRAQNRGFGSPGTLECSDHPHMVSTCETHEYYRFWKFQHRPTTFDPKNHDFEAGGGTKL